MPTISYTLIPGNFCKIGKTCTIYQRKGSNFNFQLSMSCKAGSNIYRALEENRMDFNFSFFSCKAFYIMQADNLPSFSKIHVFSKTMGDNWAREMILPFSFLTLTVSVFSEM